MQLCRFVFLISKKSSWDHLTWLRFWPLDGATCISFKFELDGTTCISSKFGHQMAPLALVANLATRWHHLHQLQIWSPSGTTCFGSKFGHQLAPFALLLPLSWSR